MHPQDLFLLAVCTSQEKLPETLWSAFAQSVLIEGAGGIFGGVAARPSSARN